MDCVHCAHAGAEKSCIERVPIFSSLTREEVSEIAMITDQRVYKKGEFIYMAGDRGQKLYVIHEGRVKITRLLDTGKEQVIRLLEPGDFFGELSLFVSAPLDNNAEVLENTTVCMIEGSRLKDMISRKPAIAVKIIEELSKRLRSSESLIETLGLQDVEQRLARALLRLAEGKTVISLPFSKKDLAAHIGISQETLSRKLSLFEDKGWIRQSGHRKISIEARTELERLSGYDL
ncbi:MAG TPA: Crp/Fnr family transcriptional regulator [Candidatus Atribacteria bacterium]|nr:Crp/Fnr family transcriptional regulator [Candidatus Atribacteria bacterium]HPT78619.1 Crp/Fnr family transcriptional regulator [Candidatus Atribacteria bacterium]